jgi:hypothetical protein
MAYTYHGTRNLISSPERSVQTFPSGLVRVERRYMCRSGDEARYRAELAAGNTLPNDDGSPSIDGLYIFPDPQEQRREDGFIEFRVTAYGRTNVTGQQNSFADTQRLTFGTFYYTGINAGLTPVPGLGIIGTSGFGVYTYDVIAKKISQSFVLNNDELASFYNFLNVPNENGIIAMKAVTIITQDPSSIQLDYSGVTTNYGIETSNFVGFGLFTECTVGFAPEFSGNIIYRAR